jgi:hypothetical protein
MKNVLKIFIFLITVQIPTFAQVRVAESSLLGFVDSGISTLIGKLKGEPKSSGLVIFNNSPRGDEWGDTLVSIDEAKMEIFRRLGENGVSRVSFIITASTKSSSPKQSRAEFWIIPQGKQAPQTEPLKPDFANLQIEMFYAHVCTDCGTPDVNRINFDPMIEALIANPAYKVKVSVDYEISIGTEMIRKDVFSRFNKIDSSRISFEAGRKFPENYDGIHYHPVYNFYLVPAKNKQ